jgi:hypothetical protein
LHFEKNFFNFVNSLRVIYPSFQALFVHHSPLVFRIFKFFI